MSESILNVTIPQPQVPFLKPNGSISEAWLYYMLGIFARTGGNTPITPATLQSQIISLAIEDAFAQPSPAHPAAAFPALMGDAMNTAPMRASGAVWALIADAMTPPPIRGLNPLLAALVI